MPVLRPVPDFSSYLMTTRPFPRSLKQKLPLFSVIVLGLFQSCGAQPRSAPSARPGLTTATAKPSPVSLRRPQGPYPDPRYRPPVNFSELQTVARKVAKASGRVIHWQLNLGENPGPLAKITGGIDDCRIFIHPIASRKVPPNTWAFIFGHEFAHRVEKLGAHGQTNPENELKADIAGARYAMAAGYRVEAFLGWMLAEPDQTTQTHGSLHKRVYAIAAHFGIPKNVILAEAKRYLKDRAKR